RQNLDALLNGLTLSQSVSYMSLFSSSYDRVRTYERGLPIMDNGTITYQRFGTNTDFSIEEGNRVHWRRANFAVDANYSQRFQRNEINAFLTARYSEYVTSQNEPAYLNGGLAGRLSYYRADKYLVDFTFGFNGSEKFAKGNRFGFFPAIAAGWILSEEPFLKNSDWVNFLKARTSFGIVGND